MNMFFLWQMAHFSYQLRGNVQILHLYGHILVPTPPGIQASPFCCRGLLNRIDVVARLAGIPPSTVTRLTEPGTTAKK